MPPRSMLSSLLVSGLVAGLLAPSSAVAGRVGYWKSDFLCPGHIGDLSTAIVAAGHTPVAVPYPQAEGLDGLDALVIASCSTWGGNTDVNAKVAAGMGLVLDIGQGQFTPGSNLPGNPSFTPVSNCPTDVDLAAGSPVASGPGGTLTNSSFDFSGGLCNLVGHVPAAQLPAGAQPFLVEGGYADRVGAFGYTYGKGRVAYSMSQISRQLPGTTASDYDFPMEWAPAALPYIANSLAWVMPAAPSATCASQGYSGTKLSWCQNICEKGYTGATLNMWLQRWIGKYRDLPYCVAD